MASFKIILAFGFLAVIVSAAPMGQMGGNGGGGEHMDPFAQIKSSLNDQQIQQLKAIWDNNSLSKQQIQDQIKAFFEQIGGDALTKFNELQSTIESKKSEITSKVEQATSNLSDEAKNLASQIKEIKQNMSLTKQQERDQMKTLFDGASGEVKQELKSLKGIFGGHHDGGHLTTPASA